MPDCVSNMADIFTKFSCTNCQEEIPGIRVHCWECVEFELCLQCFSAGAEIGSHKSDHKYQLTDSAGVLSLTRGKSGWSAREELHLLDAVEQYGFGNWEDISKHVETRSPDDAKEEYINKYLTGCIGRHTWSSANEHLPKLVDHTVADRGPLSQLLTQRLPPIEVTPEEALQLLYMPNRNDFEREYDSTAETLVSSLFLSPNDEDTDLVLKLAQLDVYTRKLRERTRRKRMVRDYQLIMNFFRGKVRRRQSKDQREFRDRYRVFAQFYTAFEFNRHLAAFEREKALRVRLSELYRYRWNGLTKFDDCIHFEQHAAAIQNKNTGPYGSHGKTDPVSGERHPSSTPYPPTKKGGESEKIGSLSSIGQKSMHPIADPTFCGGLLHNRNYSDSPQQRLDPLAPNPANQPGGPLLSSNEVMLCNKLNLPATRYITLKTVMLSGANTSIGINQTTPYNNTNNNLESSIKKYLTKAGWMATKSM